MKFIANTSALLEQLQKISGTLVSKPVLPILDHFLFELENGKLRITSTDLETSMITSLNVESEEDVKIAVPSKLTMDMLRSLPDQPVTFTIDTANQSIEIKSEQGRYKLMGQPAQDFPKIPEVSSEKSIQIPSGILLDCISKTIFSTGNDELRLNLTGVYFVLDDKQMTFVATDANRLVRTIRTDVMPGTSASFIMPKKALNLLKSNLKNDQSDVRLEFNESNAYFSFNETVLVCRLIDDKYPDYNAVIPASNPNIMTINRDDFMNSVKRISIFANKTTHQIRLKIAGSELVISAEDIDLSNEGTERLNCVYEGEDIEIGFNARLLVEMLSNIDAEEVKLELSTPNRAGILLPSENEENEDLLMLLMPMMLSSAA
jgi:DNA polymerase-3 subunit beta